jgi:uncharacterized protein
MYSARSIRIAISAWMLLMPFFADAAIRCTKKLNPAEKLICSHPGLLEMDEALNNTFEALSASTRQKAALSREQQTWLTSVRNPCAQYDCMAKAYADRTEALTERWLQSVRLRSDPLFDEEG